MSSERFIKKDGDRLFIGAYPCGYIYADRFVEGGGDFKSLGFISYETLKLDLYDGARTAPAELVAEMKQHAAELQAQRGVRVSVAGNASVPLGGKCLHELAQSRRLKTLPAGYLTPLNVMSRSLWELDRMPIPGENKVQRGENDAGTVLHWAARFGSLDQVPSELLTPEALGATAWGGQTVTDVAIASGHAGQLPSMAESLPADVTSKTNNLSA